MFFSTIGYEGVSIGDFISFLRQNDVKIVADVRLVPFSRKKGFSKKKMKEYLDQCDINYKHFPLLGCPAFIRNQYKISGDWEVYRKQYLSYLEENISAIDELIPYLDIYRLALMCFESDYNRCHRIFIGQAIENRYKGHKMSHLVPHKPFLC